MDLQPFQGINPCGYEGLRTVDLATLGIHAEWHDVARDLGDRLAVQLSE
jgi:lipoyl(octanoyl) transferase